MPHACDRVLRFADEIQTDERVAQMRADEELGREVGDHLRRNAGAVDRLQCRNVAIHDAGTNRVGERHIPVVARRVLGMLALKVMEVLEQVAGEVLFDLWFHLSHFPQRLENGGAEAPPHVYER